MKNEVPTLSEKHFPSEAPQKVGSTIDHKLENIHNDCNENRLFKPYIHPGTGAKRDIKCLECCGAKATCCTERTLLRELLVMLNGLDYLTPRGEASS